MSWARDAQAMARIALNATLLSSSPTYRSAGTSQYIRRTLQGLVRAAADRAENWDFQAYVNRPGEEIAGIGLRPVRPPLASSLHRVLWEQTRLPGLLSRTGPDIFHALVNVLPLRCPVPGIVTVLDLSFERTPEAIPPGRRMYLRAMCRHSVGQATRVVAISRTTADDLNRLYRVPGDRIDVIHVPVDAGFRPEMQAGDPGSRAVLGVPERYFLHVGTLEPRKNLGWLIDAFIAWHAGGAARRAGAADMHLVLAGARGWENADFHARVRKHGAGDRVHCTGFVPPEHMGALYRAASACIFPSRHEGFGMPLIEAMACGVPVLCNDIRVFREITQGHALFFRTRDISEIQALMTMMVQDPEAARQLRRQGLAHAAHFSELAAGHALLDVYRKVL